MSVIDLMEHGGGHIALHVPSYFGKFKIYAPTHNAAATATLATSNTSGNKLKGITSPDMERFVEDQANGVLIHNPGEGERSLVQLGK